MATTLTPASVPHTSRPRWPVAVESEKMRNRFVLDRGLGLDFLRQRAEARAQDNADPRRATPMLANRGDCFVDLTRPNATCRISSQASATALATFGGQFNPSPSPMPRRRMRTPGDKGCAYPRISARRPE